jgi:hypothetical protein
VLGQPAACWRLAARKERTQKFNFKTGARSKKGVSEHSLSDSVTLTLSVGRQFGSVGSNSVRLGRHFHGSSITHNELFILLTSIKN